MDAPDRHNGQMDVRLSIVYSFFVYSLCTFAGQRCLMPEEWRGRYFQSGIGEMYIRETRITTKGSCIEQRRNYFLFYSR